LKRIEDIYDYADFAWQMQIDDPPFALKLYETYFHKVATSSERGHFQALPDRWEEFNELLVKSKAKRPSGYRKWKKMVAEQQGLNRDPYHQLDTSGISDDAFYESFVSTWQKNLKEHAGG
jgi:hypothetical protein